MQNQVGYYSSLAVLIAFIVKLLNLHLNVSTDEIVNAIASAVVIIGACVTAFTHLKQGNLNIVGRVK